jgi:hypothetical protein
MDVFGVPLDFVLFALLRQGWRGALGFAVMLAGIGWELTDKRGRALLGGAPPVAEEVLAPSGA